MIFCNSLYIALSYPIGMNTILFSLKHLQKQSYVYCLTACTATYVNQHSWNAALAFLKIDLQARGESGILYFAILRCTYHDYLVLLCTFYDLSWLIRTSSKHFSVVELANCILIRMKLYFLQYRWYLRKKEYDEHPGYSSSHRSKQPMKGVEIPSNNRKRKRNFEHSF